MSLKTETRTIEGLTVMCTQLPAMRAYSVFARLGKVLGPAIADLAGAQLADDVQNTNIKELAPALGTLLAGIAEDESLVYPLLACANVHRDSMNIDLDSEAKINLAFQGKFKAMLLTIKFVLEVNFSDFLGDGLAALGQQKATAESE